MVWCLYCQLWREFTPSSIFLLLTKVNKCYGWLLLQFDISVVLIISWNYKEYNIYTRKSFYKSIPNSEYFEVECWLINKGFCVFLVDVFEHLLLRKTDILKTFEGISSKVWRNTLAWRAKGCKVYMFRETFILAFIFSCLLSTKPCLRFLLNCFVQEIKGFYQSSFRNNVDFRDIMNVCPNISAKN